MPKHLAESLEPDRTKPERAAASERIDRRGVLKAAVGAGLVVAAGAAAATSAAAQVPKECTSPPASKLEPNQIEITVRQGRQVIVREESSPIAEVVVQVSPDIRKNSRVFLVAARDPFCC